MGKKLHLVLALACALCCTSGISAQEETAEKPQATKKQKKSKKELQAEKQKQRLATRIKKEIPVELTDDQEKKLMELIGEKREKLKEIQKESDGLVGKENRKTVAAASREARKEGKSWPEAMKIAWGKAGISEEDQAKIAELNKERNEIFKGIKQEVATMFSDEQKEAVKAKRSKKGKGKGKGKGKKGKKKKADQELTSVSVSLPGMT